MVFTCYRSHGGLHGTQGVTEEVVPLHGGEEHLADGEDGKDESCQGDVDEDVVERHSELLVLGCDEENNKV